MEPLWSPVVATSGNQRQIACPQKTRKQAKTVAVDCVQLPRAAHGKEGVAVRVRERTFLPAICHWPGACIRLPVHMSSRGLANVLANENKRPCKPAVLWRS
jgi:hypothetical protein